MLHFGINLSDLDFDSRSQECKKAKTFAPVIPLFCILIWMVFDTLLRPVGVLNLILILSHPFNIQGREPYLFRFWKKKWKLSCIQTLADQFLLNLVWWKRSLSCTFWYQFVWPWPSFKVTVVWEINNFCIVFSPFEYGEYRMDLCNEFCMSIHVKLILILSCPFSIQHDDEEVFKLDEYGSF